jgi:hypothetical protein
MEVLRQSVPVRLAAAKPASDADSGLPPLPFYRYAAMVRCSQLGAVFGVVWATGPTSWPNGRWVQSGAGSERIGTTGCRYREWHEAGLLDSSLLVALLGTALVTNLLGLLPRTSRIRCRPHRAPRGHRPRHPPAAEVGDSTVQGRRAKPPWGRAPRSSPYDGSVE